MADKKEKTPRELALDVSRLQEVLRATADSEVYRQANLILDPVRAWLRDHDCEQALGQKYKRLFSQEDDLIQTVEAYHRAYQKSIENSFQLLQKLCKGFGRGKILKSQRTEMEKITKMIGEKSKVRKFTVDYTATEIDKEIERWRTSQLRLDERVKYRSPDTDSEKTAERVFYQNPELLCYAVVKLLQYFHMNSTRKCFVQLIIESTVEGVLLGVLTSQEFMPIHMEIDLFNVQRDSNSLAILFWLATLFDVKGLQHTRRGGNHLIFFVVPASKMK